MPVEPGLEAGADRGLTFGLGAGPLLFVHAHPDDESITTAATMAAAVQAGVSVALVTCTRGELGEVIGPHAARLTGDPQALAAHRVGELADAMTALGVTDHRFLGDHRGRRYRDSGMVWVSPGVAGTPPDLPADAFAAADLDEAAADLAEVIAQLRPATVICYEAGGGYGHPDHVQAHRVSRRALEMTGSARFALIVTPISVWQQRRDELEAAGLATRDGDVAPAVVRPDAEVSHVVDAGHLRAVKAAAMRAHTTQIVVHPDEHAFALSDGVWQPLSGVEYYLIDDPD